MWGEEIQAERKRLGWSIKQLAAEMGNVVTPQAIGMWERGETAPRIQHQVKVARALGVRPHHLFRVEDAA